MSIGRSWKYTLRTCVETFLPALLLCVLVPPQAWGTEQYAERFKAKCKFCHLRSTSQLNEVGQQIRKDMTAEVKAAAEEKAKAAGAPGQPEKQPTPGGPAKEGEGAPEKGTGDKAGADTPPAPVYRWTGSGGELYFTDNGDRYANRQVGEERPKPVRKGTRQAARTPSKKPRVPATAPAKPLPVQSYERCMEEILASAPQPPSGRETMDLLMNAEKRCAPGRMPRR